MILNFKLIDKKYHYTYFFMLIVFNFLSKILTKFFFYSYEINIFVKQLFCQRIFIFFSNKVKIIDFITIK